MYWTLGSKLQLVGDDNFVTNPRILAEGIKAGIAHAILVKLNQIGTVSETLETVAIAQKAGSGAVISHRSGEKEAHSSLTSQWALALAKSKPAPFVAERIAKYNRLLECSLGKKTHAEVRSSPRARNRREIWGARVVPPLGKPHCH